jgi:hypothetical protein
MRRARRQRLASGLRRVAEPIETRFAETTSPKIRVAFARLEKFRRGEPSIISRVSNDVFRANQQSRADQSATGTAFFASYGYDEPLRLSR